MATLIDTPPPPALAAAKDYLRIETDAEDATVATLIASAIGLCERFTGLTLIAATRTDTLPVASGRWQRLPATPVGAITAVAGLGVGGEAIALPAAAFAIDIDAAGDGWVRADAAPAAATRLRVTYRAGLAADWAGLPAPLRQGVVRLAAHLHAHRDAGDDAGPPAAVAALWRPYRRMRLR